MLPLTRTHSLPSSKLGWSREEHHQELHHGHLLREDQQRLVVVVPLVHLVVELTHKTNLRALVPASQVEIYPSIILRKDISTRSTKGSRRKRSKEDPVARSIMLSELESIRRDRWALTRAEGYNMSRGEEYRTCVTHAMTRL